MAQTEEIEFVVTGAMTNLAIILRAFPDIHRKIRGITVMGGAIGLGNWNPAA
jgi:pyrimidine-specific ribonucleoside hydrolase